MIGLETMTNMVQKYYGTDSSKSSDFGTRIMIWSIIVLSFAASLCPVYSVSSETAAMSVENGNYRVAFVKSTFTGAAYNNAFYPFYNKYNYIEEGVKVYKNLDKLTGYLSDAPANNPDMFKWIDGLVSHTARLLQNSTISVLEDAEINDGKLFKKNGTNAYDVLIFGHEEYATKAMYDNIRKFVARGGVALFLDGNIFYAEVTYDPTDQSVTLKKGHSWAYNGIYATRSVYERWANETSSWIGSNYYEAFGPANKYKNGTYIYNYLNDPFDYSPVRFEDQYVTNPAVNIIWDYQYSDPEHKIATYWKPFGAGKVIVMGIFFERIQEDPRFLDFYDKLLTEYALSNPNTIPEFPTAILAMATLMTAVLLLYNANYVKLLLKRHYHHS